MATAETTKGDEMKITATAASVETDYEHDDYSAIVSVDVLLDGQPVGEVWVRAGVPQSLEGTARAAGTTSGMETVEPYGPSRDTWCPDALLEVDRDTIMDAVRDIALAAWREAE